MQEAVVAVAIQYDGFAKALPLLGELATPQALTEEKFNPLDLYNQLLVTLRTVGGVSFS